MNVHEGSFPRQEIKEMPNANAVVKLLVQLLHKEIKYPQRLQPA